MSQNDAVDRTKVTFSQAEGLAPLPEPLKLGELSAYFRSLMWRVVFESVGEDIADKSIRPRLQGDWLNILYDKHVLIDHRPADEFTSNPEPHIASLKQLFMEGAYNEVFDFLQFVLRHPSRPYRFQYRVEGCLEAAGAAYLVIDDGPTIIPRATPEEGETLKTAFATMEAGGYDGARAHLRKAAEAINAGHYADSVRESVHAVESVARRIDDDSAKSLKPALDAVAAAGNIHPALKHGFEKIYGFTSDEDGIRHALLEDHAKVDQTDAVFMLGACASFATYLINKARVGGIIAE